jgi:hypothetical protein
MGLFGALMLMVLATTLITPPLLGRVARAQPSDGSPAVGVASDTPGEGGIDDLVAGTSRDDMEPTPSNVSPPPASQRPPH